MILKAARELLGESQGEMALASKRSRRAIQRAETAASSMSVHESLIRYFEHRGLRFLPPRNGEGWCICEAADHGETDVPARLVRAARVGLQLSQQSLGADASLSVSTVRRIEADKESVEQETKLFLVQHLLSRRVEFIPPDGSIGWAVRWNSMQDESKARAPRPNTRRGKQGAFKPQI